LYIDGNDRCNNGIKYIFWYFNVGTKEVLPAENQNMSEPKTMMFVSAGNNGSGKSMIRYLIIE
jgi:hypothetical protein